MHYYFNGLILPTAHTLKRSSLWHLLPRLLNVVFGNGIAVAADDHVDVAIQIVLEVVGDDAGKGLHVVRILFVLINKHYS